MVKIKYLVLLLVCLAFPGHSQLFNILPVADMDSVQGDSRGVIFTDLNADGLPDLYIVNGPKGGEQNELYINDGNGKFKQEFNGLTNDVSASVGATFADIDNDGDLDAYVANWYNEVNDLIMSEDGKWRRVKNPGLNSSGNSESAAWGDYNGDGIVDLAIANGSLGSGQLNVLTRSTGPMTFEFQQDQFVTDIANTRTLNWTDFDGDGDLDLFTGHENRANEIYLNVGGTLVLDSTSSLLDFNEVTFGSSVADFDNDGDFDIIAMNFGRANFVHLNDGKGNFEIGQALGGNDFTIGSSFGDYDNDGDLDLVTVNGFVAAGQTQQNDLYLNDGTGRFELVASDPISASRSVSYGVANADYDGDGDLDICIANIQGASNTLFQNIGNNNNWVKFKLTGTVSNRSAIGTVLRLKAVSGGVESWQTRLISSQTGYTSQNDLVAHFGLKDASVIELLRIEWPSGNVSEYENLEINKTHDFTEPLNSGQFKVDFKTSLSWDEKYKIEMSNLSVYQENAQPQFEWDLDNDGNVDSNEREPIFEVKDAGEYEIRLKVIIDGVEKEATSVIELNEDLVLGFKSPEQNMLIYPNPVEDFFYVKSSDIPEQIRLFDLSGYELKRWKGSADSYDIFDLDSGLYLVRILKDNKARTFPIVKR